MGNSEADVMSVKTFNVLIQHSIDVLTDLQKLIDLLAICYPNCCVRTYRVRNMSHVRVYADSDVEKCMVTIFESS